MVNLRFPPSRRSICRCFVAIVSFFPLHSASASNDVVNTIRFLSDGKRMLLCSSNPFVPGNPARAGLFSAASRKLLRSLPPSTALFAPDDSYYVTGGKPMRAYTPQGRVLHSFPSYRIVRPSAISPDGKWLFGAGENGYLAIWSAKTGALISKPGGGPGSPLYFSPDSRWVYGNASVGPICYRIDERGGVTLTKSFMTAQLDSSDGFAVNFGRRLICAATLRSHNFQNPTTARVCLVDFSGRTLSRIRLNSVAFQRGAIQIRFSYEGNYVAILTADELTIRSINGLKVLRRYTPRNLGLRNFGTLDFSPQSNVLAIGGWGRFAPVLVHLP